MLGRQSGELPINAVSVQTVEGPPALTCSSKWSVLTQMTQNNCYTSSQPIQLKVSGTLICSKALALAKLPTLQSSDDPIVY